jgi:hypothetical protein
MPRTYHNLGLSFQYPDNWMLDESDANADSTGLGESHSITVSSPGGAFWTLVKHHVTQEPARALETSLTAMREVYPDLDVERTEEEIAGHRLRGYELNFICLDLTNTAVLQSFRTPTASFLIMYQADDREFDQVKHVFDAITTSLLHSLTPQKEATWPPKRFFDE